MRVLAKATGVGEGGQGVVGRGYKLKRTLMGLQTDTDESASSTAGVEAEAVELGEWGGGGQILHF